MNSKIIILGILAKMALLVLCKAKTVDPTKEADYHKEYLEYKINQLAARIAHETNVNFGNLFENLKKHYVEMQTHAAKIPETPLPLPKKFNGEDAKYTNVEGKVIPELVYIGYEIARLDKEMQNFKPDNIPDNPNYIILEEDLGEAKKDFFEESLARGLVKADYHYQYLEYKTKKLQREAGDPKRLAYFENAFYRLKMQIEANGKVTYHQLPLPMALPQIGYAQMKYTDKNGLPIYTLTYIGYEIAFLSLKLTKNNSVLQKTHRKKLHKKVSQIEKDLEEARQDMVDELKELKEKAKSMPNAEKNSQTPPLNGKTAGTEGKGHQS